MLVEFPDPAERAARLRELIGIEDRVWVKIEGFDRVYAIADEDMERETEEKTSSVHFLRFELSSAMIDALHNDASLSMGISHSAYQASCEPIQSGVRDSLMDDLITGSISQ